MSYSTTLSSEEFVLLHNGKCEISEVYNSLRSVIHPALLAKMKHGLAQMDAALASVYARETEAFDRRENYFAAIQLKRDLKTRWSMHEVEDMDAPHPYHDAIFVTYKGFVMNNLGPNWIDLWLAAEKLVTQSGDMHHIFIEGFAPTADKHTLVLSTGS